jgi:putative photosynthetic complex assembly protein
MSDTPQMNAAPEMTAAQARHPELVNRDREMIPPVLLKAMAMLALTSLALVTYAVLTDRPLTGVPQPAPEVASRVIALDGHVDGSVIVLDEAGAVLSDLGPDEAGFVSVVWRAMNRERMLHGVAETAPLRLVEMENGRLTVFDDETGWSVELGSFGQANRAAFERLLYK